MEGRSFYSFEQEDEAISGPSADSDGDGLSNLELYAYGLLPGIPSPSPLNITTEPAEGGQGYHYRFTFPFTENYADVSYRLESSTNITSGWQDASFSVISKEDEGDTSTVTIQADEIIDDETSIFYRLAFDLNE